MTLVSTNRFTITTILYTEFLVLIISLILTIIDMRVFSGKMRNKTTLSLFTFFISIQFIYLSRVVGISLDNLIIRQNVATLFALITALSFFYWGALVRKLSGRIIHLSNLVISLGMVLYVVGKSTNEILSTLGVFLTGMAMIAHIISMFLEVFRKTPYVLARQRIFVMATSFVFLIICGAMGVVFLGQQNYALASLFFFLEVFARLLISIGIRMPRALQNKLSHFIS